MTIYTSEKILPYVYRLDNPITGEFYIGYREVNKLPSHLDLPEYRTSSTYVKPRFEEFIITILAEFFLGDDAYDHEQLIIYENWNNSSLMNKRCYYGKLRMKNTGTQIKPVSDKARANMSIAQTGKPKSDSHKANMSISRTGLKHPPRSDEFKVKMSNIQMGKIRGPYKKKIK